MTDTDPADDDRRFEMAIRLMGNEVIAISLFSSTRSAKWIWMSIGAMLVILIGFIVYGADLGAIYRSFLPA